MEPKIYLYKMTTDNGGAPCVKDDLLSLAICKPVIRRVAEKGSIIFGFGGKKYGERLLYIAEVTDKPIPPGKYYRDKRYKNRTDCIYEEKDGEASLKKNAQYHKSGERDHDVGKNFEKAYVLISTDFRYFGKNGTANYKRRHLAIKSVVEGMGRSFQVNHDDKVREDLLCLKEEMWKNPKKTQGKPTSSDQRELCNRGGITEICKKQ